MIIIGTQIVIEKSCPINSALNRARKFNYQRFEKSVAKEIVRSFLNLGFEKSFSECSDDIVLSQIIENENGQFVRTVTIGCRFKEDKEYGFFDTDFIKLRSFVTI